MKLKKCLYLLMAVLVILNSAASCEASEKLSPDLIRFLGTAWEPDVKESNVFIGSLQNVSGRDIEFIGLRCAF